MLDLVSIKVPRPKFSMRGAVGRGDVNLSGPGSVAQFEGMFQHEPILAVRLYLDYLAENDLEGLLTIEEVTRFAYTALLPALLRGQSAEGVRLHIEIDGQRTTFCAASGNILADTALREADWLAQMREGEFNSWMRSFLPADMARTPLSSRSITRDEANLIYGGQCGKDNNCGQDTNGDEEDGPCIANTKDPDCNFDICWMQNDTPDPGCGTEHCGTDVCGWDACGANACGAATCGVAACFVEGCGMDGCAGAVCGADGCGGNACGADGGPVGACPANACPANVI